MQQKFDALRDADISTDSFSFYTSVSSVYSSKIEGEEMELDNYIKHKRFGIEFLPDYTRKIDDLYNAYIFAKNKVLNESNIYGAHKLLSKNVVAKHRQGKLRTQNMYVNTPDGKIEYVAVSPFEIESEMNKLYDDIKVLLNQNLCFEEVFFFAALLHLVFVKIHPFNDGNGRKWPTFRKMVFSAKIR